MITSKVDELEEEILPLFSVPQFSARHSSWTVASLRALIFRKNKNGLEEAEAIFKVGRRVFISEPRFFRWVLSQQGGGDDS